VTGVQTCALPISNTTPRFPIRLERRNQDGLRTFHCIDGGEYSRIADWPNPFLHDSFRSALAEFRPGVVHFHNYLSLGDDLVGTALYLLSGLSGFVSGQTLVVDGGHIMY
jgi:NAD(P)-dependent dehydrogenase (short-subunit alcohol dehydrogenase family)